MLVGVKHLREALLRDFQQRHLAPGSRTPSFRRLARTYNVSVPTVQRAIAALEEEGFVQTVHGRGTFLTPKLQPYDGNPANSGVILAAFPFHSVQPDLLRAVQRRALAHGCLLAQWYVEPFSQDLEYERQLIRHVIQERLRGLLLFTSPVPPTNHKGFLEAREAGVRVIHLSQYREDMSAEEYVVPDFYRVGVAAAVHGMCGGYRRFVSLIMGGRPDYFGRSIRAGFEETLQDQGVPPDRIQRTASAKPQQAPLEAGTLYVSDFPWVLDKLKGHFEKAELRVPEDVGLLCAGEAIEVHHSKRFSAVRLSYEAQFRAALEGLFAGDSAKPVQERIPPHDLRIITTRAPA